MATISIAEQKHNLTGYVRNTENKTVQGEVQGDYDHVHRFIRDLKNGPGKVSNVISFF